MHSKEYTNEQATFLFFINGRAADGTPRKTRFRTSAWVVDDFKQGALLGTSWFDAYHVIIDVRNRLLEPRIVKDFYVPVTSTAKPSGINRRVVAAERVTIPPHEVAHIQAFHKELPQGQEFAFEASHSAASNALIDSGHPTVVRIANESDEPLRINAKEKLGNIVEVAATEGTYSTTTVKSIAKLAMAGAIAAAGRALSDPRGTPESAVIDGTEVVAEDFAKAPLNAEIEVNSADFRDIFFNDRSHLTAPEVTVTSTATDNADEPSVEARDCVPEPPMPPDEDEAIPSHLHQGRLPFERLQKIEHLPEVMLPNGVSIYAGDEDFVNRVTDLVTEYDDVWHDTDFIRVDEEDEMEVPLVDNWHTHKIAQRPYPQGLKERQVIDETFDELHRQGRMEWNTKPTPFAAPCFVVYRTIGDKTKARVVYDLRGLNEAVIPDNYPLPRQESIINAVRGCTYITCVDAMSFFYQFRVKHRDRNRFTITSHRGLEYMKVPPMGFRNSPAYVQRFMDRIFRKFKAFALPFVDDIVIFSPTKEAHLEYLEKVFQLLKSLNVLISLTKTWIGYLLAMILGFKVDAFGLTSTDERVEAFRKLKFPSQLAALEQYIGASVFLRHLIPWYGCLVEPLQSRKTALLAVGRELGKVVDNKKSKRKAYTKATWYDPTPKEVEAFEALQKEICSGRVNRHQDPEKALFLQCDASLYRGFGALLFHLKDGYEWKEGTGIPASQVEPIAFLSRTLTNAERTYGPSELEVAGLVWTVKKAHAMIQSAHHPVVVLTDHSAAKQIVEKKTMDTSSTDRGNRRLVVASIYLSQYQFRVFHIPGKENFIPDALSRLKADESKDLHRRRQPEYAALDDEVFLTMESDHGPERTYATSTALMSEGFRKRLIDGYPEDDHWKSILNSLIGPRLVREDAEKEL